MTNKPNDKITRRQTLAAMIAASIVPAMARQARAAEPDFAAFNTGYAKNIVLPAFTHLRKACAIWAKDAADLEKVPSAAKLDIARRWFDPVSDAWMRAQQFRLGPLSEGQRAERFAYWPERRNVVAKQLAALVASNDPAELEPKRFAEASVAIQGLPALERLLYGDEKAADTVDDFFLGPRAGRHCAIFRAITANLLVIAEECEAAWSAVVGDPAKSTAPFAANSAEATTQFYTNLLTMLQIVAEQKIGAPLGADIASENPKVAEQWRSSRSGRNIDLNLTTAQNSFLAPGGFATLLRPGHADLVAEVEKAFATVRLLLRPGHADLVAEVEKAFATVLDAPGVSFTAKAPNDYSQLLDELKLEGVVIAEGVPQISDEDRRKNATDLIVKINHLRDILRQKVPPAIGITLGFNELDGDGS